MGVESDPHFQSVYFNVFDLYRTVVKNYSRLFLNKNKMELKTAIEILEYHQEWRIGKREDMIHSPKKLTEAIDIILLSVKIKKKINLLDFINRHIQPNSIIRLLYKTKEGYKAVNKKWEDISMEWEVARLKGANRHYANNKVIGVASILSDCRYPEAINIVIEKMENQPFVNEAKEDTSTQCESNKN